MAPQRPPRRPAIALLAAWAVLAAIVVSAPPAAAQSTPLVNEALSVNSTGSVDDHGDTSDWVELYNPGASSADLGGWGMSDDAGTPFAFRFPPGTTIEAQGYLLVRASGSASTDDELHAPFKLSGDGDWIGLFRPDGSASSSLELPALLADHSYGRSAAGTLAVFTSPTPGRANGSGVAGIVADVQASPGRGIYHEPVRVQLTHPDPSVTIRYTTDGSAPTAGRGTVYGGQFTVSQTTTLRVGAFRDGWLNDHPSTHTYIFPDDVAEQGSMHAVRVDTAAERDTVAAALVSLPTVSLVARSSITTRGPVQTSVEWIDPMGGPSFQVDAGIKEVGAASVGYPKDSWRVAFDSEWGESSLHFPIYEGGPDPGPVAPAATFKRLTLRSGAHDTLFYNSHPTWIRNRWGDATMLSLGHVNTHGRYAHVYLNGEYVGQYHVREHFDDHFMAAYHGGDNSEYLGVNRGTVTAGSGDSWSQLSGAARNWSTFRETVDPVAYIDWMLLNEYQGNNWDLQVARNWRAAGPAHQPIGWPGFLFQGSDQDVVFPNATASTRFPGPASSWSYLRSERDPDFVALVNDRVQTLLRDGGALTPSGATELWDRLGDEIRPAMAAELARWGAHRANYSMTTWQQDLDFVADIMAGRTDWLLDRLDSYGLLSPLAAPEISPGPIQAADPVPAANPNGQGTVLVTTDGTDPRLAGGAASPAAQPADLVTLDRTTTVQARVLHGTTWSPLVVIEVQVQADPEAPLVDDIADLTTVQRFAVAYQVAAVDPQGDVVEFDAVGLPDGVSIDPRTGRIRGVPFSAGSTTATVLVSDGVRTTRVSFEWTVIAHSGSTDTPVVLNEYNAVKSSLSLAENGSDPILGRIEGNGGDWLELLVVESGIDLRGWQVELWDRENGDLAMSDTIVLSQDPALAELVAGTLVVISEDQGEDPAYDPHERDYSIHARSATGTDSVLVTAAAGNFDTNRHEFRVLLRDGSDRIRSPFMGETDQVRSLTNVGGDEVYVRCDTPTPSTRIVDGDHRDATESSFGEPNRCGNQPQDLSQYRRGFRGDVSCDSSTDIADALVIARYEARIDEPVADCEQRDVGTLLLGAGDFNRDGRVNIGDALAIARCEVGHPLAVCFD